MAFRQPSNWLEAATSTAAQVFPAVGNQRSSSPTQDPLSPLNSEQYPRDDADADADSDNPSHSDNFRPRFNFRLPNLSSSSARRHERPESPEESAQHTYPPRLPRINSSEAKAAVGIFRSLWRASRRLPRITYVIIGLAMMTSWVVIMYIFIEHEANYQKKNLDAIRLPPEYQNTLGGLFLVGALRQFDPDSHQLTVDWSMDFLVNNNPATPLGGGVGPNQVGIYLNRAAIPETRFNSTDSDAAWRAEVNDHKNQIYSVDNLNATPDAILGEHTWDTFSTNIFFNENSSDVADPWREPMFGYPWDYWEGSMVFVANNYSKAMAQNQPNSYVIPIVGATLASSTLNWRINITDSQNTCALTDNNSGCELHVTFNCRRPALVVFAAITAVVINWILTVFIFIMTCEAVVMGRMDVIKDVDVLTWQFLTTTLRAFISYARKKGVEYRLRTPCFEEPNIGDNFAVKLLCPPSFF